MNPRKLIIGILLFVFAFASFGDMQNVFAKSTSKPCLDSAGKNICQGPTFHKNSQAGSQLGSDYQKYAYKTGDSGTTGLSSPYCKAIPGKQNTGQFVSVGPGGDDTERRCLGKFDSSAYYAEKLKNIESTWLTPLAWIVWLVAIFLSIVSGFLVSLAQFALDNALGLFTDSGFQLAIEQNWNILRGFANTGFVLVLVYVAFRIAMGYESDNYTLKKSLPAVIISVVLVNFSMIIFYLMIDFSTIVSDSLYATIANGEVNKSNVIDTLANRIVPGMDFDKLDSALDASDKSWSTETKAAPFLAGSFVIILFAFYALAILTLSFVLILNWLILSGLAIVGPLALAAYALPETRQYTSKWGKTLFQHAMIPVILAFFLSMAMILSDQIRAFMATSKVAENLPDILSIINLGGEGFNFAQLLQIAIVVICIHYGATTAIKTDYTSHAINAAKSIGNKARGFFEPALRKTAAIAAVGGVGSMALAHPLAAAQLAGVAAGVKGTEKGIDYGVAKTKEGAALVGKTAKDRAMLGMSKMMFGADGKPHNFKKSWNPIDHVKAVGGLVGHGIDFVQRSDAKFQAEKKDHEGNVNLAMREGAAANIKGQMKPYEDVKSQLNYHDMKDQIETKKGELVGLEGEEREKKAGEISVLQTQIAAHETTDAHKALQHVDSIDLETSEKSMRDGFKHSSKLYRGIHDGVRYEHQKTADEEIKRRLDNLSGADLTANDMVKEVMQDVAAGNIGKANAEDRAKIKTVFELLQNKISDFKKEEHLQSIRDFMAAVWKQEGEMKDHYIIPDIKTAVGRMRKENPLLNNFKMKTMEFDYEGEGTKRVPTYHWDAEGIPPTIVKDLDPKIISAVWKHLTDKQREAAFKIDLSDPQKNAVHQAHISFLENKGATFYHESADHVVSEGKIKGVDEKAKTITIEGGHVLSYDKALDLKNQDNIKGILSFRDNEAKNIAKAEEAEEKANKAAEVESKKAAEAAEKIKSETSAQIKKLESELSNLNFGADPNRDKLIREKEEEINKLKNK